MEFHKSFWQWKGERSVADQPLYWAPVVDVVWSRFLPLLFSLAFTPKEAETRSQCATCKAKSKSMEINAVHCFYLRKEPSCFVVHSYFLKTTSLLIQTKSFLCHKYSQSFEVVIRVGATLCKCWMIAGPVNKVVKGVVQREKIYFFELISL